ncbi:xylulokinase [Alteromonas aestuariivivens]|uniref:Xylulose kinase n=1 Tax=Alteromonas aestuariivivens TaxID=1938339 RepID=A0A3D8M7F3_9ALTE|nr:xylulokinase [Alteromonas aestuariivivens]RDV25590.1 xylulokinase [Alteromonas aestuariivivens]
MFIGIDLGTSGVKTIITDATGAVVASAKAPLDVSIPRPLWSEQNPEDWWQATLKSLDELASTHNLGSVQAIGLAGQMHGATLLDKQHKVLRPAILWNDGRSESQCQQIEAQVPNAREVTGNLVMPGFTAPKLLWVKQNEPDVFARVDKVLLPKDYLRFRLCGEFASDMSDSAGTAWLNTAERNWNAPLLDACGLSISHMPKLYEGNEVTGYLSADLANRWGLKQVPIVAGAGDNAAGAIGCGIVNPGQAMLSLGTSGVYFAVTREFKADPETAVHSFCHALPNRWHLMSVMLSAASCLQWYADNSGYRDVGELFADLEANTRFDDPAIPLFMPYLTGERTPHNNPNAKAGFVGITAATTRAHMAQAVVQGVSMALADGIDAVHQCGVEVDGISLIGGGVKSTYWRQLLADVSGIPMNYRRGGDVGPALGAARLAQAAMYPKESISNICPVPELEQSYTPNSDINEFFLQKRQKFRELYYAIEPQF